MINEHPVMARLPERNEVRGDGGNGDRLDVARSLRHHAASLRREAESLVSLASYLEVQAAQ